MSSGVCMYVGTGGTAKMRATRKTTRQQPYRGHLGPVGQALACRAAWITSLMRYIDKPIAERLPGGPHLVITSERGIGRNNLSGG